MDYYTGYYTFAGTDLSTIKQLNLTNAHFTSVADGTNVYEIFTAYNTFSDTNLSGLITLNLNNATFSPTMNMNVEDMESLYINTGCSTFMGADLSRLEILDLSHTLFIETTQYTAGVQHIYTG